MSITPSPAPHSPAAFKGTCGVVVAWVTRDRSQHGLSFPRLLAADATLLESWS